MTHHKQDEGSKATCRTCGASGPPWQHVPSVFDPDGIGDPGHAMPKAEGYVADATGTDLVGEGSVAATRPVKSAITPPSQANDKELEADVHRIIGEYGAFNHMGVQEGNTVVQGILALIHKDRAAAAQELQAALEHWKNTQVVAALDNIKLPSKIDALDVGVLTGPNDYKGKVADPEHAAYLMAYNQVINTVASTLAAEKEKYTK